MLWQGVRNRNPLESIRRRLEPVTNKLEQSSGIPIASGTTIFKKFEVGSVARQKQTTPVTKASSTDEKMTLEHLNDILA
jgi:hypothetical protein